MSDVIVRGRGGREEGGMRCDVIERDSNRDGEE